MYDNRYNRHNPNDFFNPNLFVPGLAVYEDVAEGLIRLCSRIAAFISNLANGRA